MFNGDSNEDIPEWMKEKILASIQEEMADTSIEQEPEDIDDDEDSKKPKS
ncbi:hypothetical protein [Halalkalibacter wakoensis]|nr:hypothetical protein [Halalkalibacter wakoensis]